MADKTFTESLKDLQKAAADIGRQATTLEDSLRQSYEWFRNNRNSIVRKPLKEFIDRELRKEKP